jgi:TPP-dependent pyruvate/acetoin dehydrogenase alpha subunit
MISQAIEPNNEVSLLYGMLLIRRIEEALIAEYPKQEMRCPVHFSIGQEAIAVGVSSNLTRQDWIVSNHRSHAHYIAKGGNLKSFIAELYGKESGCCLGRGGSMHLTDLKAGFLAGIPIVGSSMPIAAGVAMSQSWGKLESLTVAYIGDAAAESGSFHETLNFASLHNLPLLTICENNEYSIFTPLSQRQPMNRTITDLASSHGIKTYRGNGDNILEVVEVTREAKNYILTNSKPAFIEFSTYRLLEHCGPNFDDDLNYRDPNDVKNFTNRDPISILLKKLIQENKFGNEKLSLMDETIKLEISQLIDDVKKEPDATYSLENTMFWSRND